MKALMVLICALVFAICAASQTAEAETDPAAEESATPVEEPSPPVEELGDDGLAVEAGTLGALYGDDLGEVMGNVGEPAEEAATATIPPADQAAPAQESTGSLSKEVIREVVRQSADALEACYEPRLAQVPNLAGKTYVKFTIGTDGTVSAASVESGIDEELDACVVGVVKAMVFPPPKGGGLVIVKYPFIFQPG